MKREEKNRMDLKAERLLSSLTDLSPSILEEAEERKKKKIFSSGIVSAAAAAAVILILAGSLCAGLLYRRSTILPTSLPDQETAAFESFEEDTEVSDYLDHALLSLHELAKEGEDGSFVFAASMEENSDWDPIEELKKMSASISSRLEILFPTEHYTLCDTLSDSLECFVYWAADTDVFTLFPQITDNGYVWTLSTHPANTVTVSDTESDLFELPFGLSMGMETYTMKEILSDYSYDVITVSPGMHAVDIYTICLPKDDLISVVRLYAYSELVLLQLHTYFEGNYSVPYSPLLSKIEYGFSDAVDMKVCREELSKKMEERYGTVIPYTADNREVGWEHSVKTEDVLSDSPVLQSKLFKDRSFTFKDYQRITLSSNGKSNHSSLTFDSTKQVLIDLLAKYPLIMEMSSSEDNSQSIPTESE